MTKGNISEIIKNKIVKRITSTQYLKKGDSTNVGVVENLHEYKGITTTDGFYHDLNEEVVLKTGLTTQQKVNILKKHIGSKMQNGDFVGELLEVKNNGDFKVSCSNWWENVNDNKYYLI